MQTKYFVSAFVFVLYYSCPWGCEIEHQVERKILSHTIVFHFECALKFDFRIVNDIMPLRPLLWKEKITVFTNDSYYSVRKLIKLFYTNAFF